MTDVKEAIIKSTLKYLVKMQIEEGSVGFAVDNDCDHDCCWDDVLAWIESQPCKDCISRKYIEPIVEELENICINGDEHILSLLSNIKNAPPVTPKYTDEEIDKAQAVEQAYVDKMVELAVEETKRPKGHWIIIDDCELFMAKCSECGEIVDSRMINKYPYCHCGAEMSGGREDG